MKAADFTALDDAGLNLHAILNLAQLPAEITADLRRRCDPTGRYRQLILIGHGGRTLWSALKASGISSDNPIDDFSSRTVEHWFTAQFPGTAHEIIYPGAIPLGLQALGRIAGWHHASPFMVGIHPDWGTWFAYRVVLLAATDLAASTPRRSESPCTSCADKPCVASCPAGALDDDRFTLEKCLAYRRQASSRCKTTCIARITCPVGGVHRYSDEQITHSYSISLRDIERRR